MEQLDYLIRTLNPNVKIPESKQEKEDLIRTLMNIWEVEKLPEQFFDIQDEYLKQKLSEKKIVGLDELDEVEKNIYLNPLKISFFQIKIVLLHPKLKTLI